MPTLTHIYKEREIKPRIIILGESKYITWNDGKWYWKDQEMEVLKSEDFFGSECIFEPHIIEDEMK